MAIRDLANDQLTVRKPDGSTFGPFGGVVSKGKGGGSAITLLDDQVDVAPRDTITRKLPNGREECFIVEEADFSNSPFPDIPSCWDIVARKDSQPPRRERASQTINVGTATNLQIGDHNTQNVLNAFQQLSKLIDESEAPAKQKAAAKGRLLKLLEHPLVTTLLGAGARSILP